MRIQHNIMAMSAYRNYTNNVAAMKKNLEKLSSGYKINRAGDDAAGLAISEKMRAQITGLETAQKNAKDGISLVQTAEGALTEVHDMLNRMVELATQSANGTYDNTTDRNQMQKEVDQLLKEIDRIADSSNFNGINLLDGTLGMNTDAFEVGGTTDYVGATLAKTSNVSLATADYHGGKAVTPQAPSFVVDLNDLQLTNTGTATGTVSATIAFGDFSLNIEVANVKAGSNATIGAITTAITTALGTQHTATIGTKKCFEIGGLQMTAAAAGGKITFTYVAAASDATAVDTTGSKITKALASAFNAAIGAEVEVTAGSDTKLKDGTKYICALTAVKNAVGNEPAERPGATIDLTDYMKDGYKLTIASGTASNAAKTTYVFKTDKNSTVTAGAGETLIDVSNVAASNQAKHAAWIIAGGVVNTGTPSKPDGANANGQAQTAAGGMFKVSAGTGAKIHIDVAAAANASKADTKEKMEKLISVTTPAQAAKNATTKLTVTASNIKEGNVLNIGNKTYTFTGTETLDDVKTMIGADYTVTDGTTTGELLISAKTISSTAAAPMILGKGLTLQIGDTSDNFNQLNVAVQDMHAASIGVGGLRIDTEEAAQAAIDKIKSAINTVSDVRGTLGATQNRLDHTINNLSVMTENIQDAESTIRDVDVAEEMMAYTKNNILIQSAQAMLAQANQVPQGVLQLLQ